MFIIIVIVLMAFSSNKKTIEVVRDGEVVETRIEHGGSTARSASRVALFIVIGLPILLLIVAAMAGA